LKGTLDDLDFYQSLELDLKVLQRYHNELVVAKFLSGLDTSLGNQLRGHIPRGDTVPSLSTTLTRVYHFSMRGDSSSGVSSGVKNSDMVARERAKMEDVDAIVAAIQGKT